MTKQQIKAAQLRNAVLNNLEVFGFQSKEFLKAAKEYIEDKKRFTSGSVLKVFNDRLELHQGYRYCGSPDAVMDCRRNSLYTRP